MSTTKIDNGEYSCCAFVLSAFTDSANFAMYVTKIHPLKFYQDYSEMLADLNMGYVYLDDTYDKKNEVRFLIDTSVIDADTDKLIEFKQGLNYLNLLGVQMVRLLFSISYNNVGEILLDNYKKYKEELTPSELILTTLLPLMAIYNYQGFSYNNTYSPILFRAQAYQNKFNRKAQNLGFLTKLNNKFKTATETRHLYLTKNITINGIFHNLNANLKTTGSQFLMLLFQAMIVATDNFADPIESMNLIYKYDKLYAIMAAEYNKPSDNSDILKMLQELETLLLDNNYAQILNSFLNENI